MQRNVSRNDFRRGINIPEYISEDLAYLCGIFVDVDARAISSSSIRDKISRNESIESLVPSGVNSYIHSNRLYN